MSRNKDHKATLVLGASLKPYRYSNMAIQRLREKGFPVYALGPRLGNVGGVEIFKEMRPLDDVHTVTLYLNPQRQEGYYEYIISLKPKRVIFNPGTENNLFYKMLEKQNIEAIEACTLVMLSNDLY